jgi:hypothetical protein
MADEQPVFHPEFGRSYGVFDQVVVQPGLAVFGVAGQRGPLRQQVPEYLFFGFIDNEATWIMSMRGTAGS